MTPERWQAFLDDVDARRARMRGITDRMLASLTPRERRVLDLRFKLPASTPAIARARRLLSGDRSARLPGDAAEK